LTFGEDSVVNFALALATPEPRICGSPGPGWIGDDRDAVYTVPSLLTARREGADGMAEVARPVHLVIRTEARAGARVLALFGELDIASVPQLEYELAKAEAPGSRIVIDLSGLEFIDSSGLHMLLNANRRFEQTGHQLVLRRGPRAVQRLFELTQTQQRFRFED
jgi:anti-sigma B factor antagonist